MFRKLLDLGANPYSAFQAVHEGGSLEIVLALLDAGADPSDALARAVIPSGFGFTSGEESKNTLPGNTGVRMVDALLWAGADPASVNGQGTSLLALAITHHQIEVASRLLEAGVPSSTATPGSDLEILIQEGIVAERDGMLTSGNYLLTGGMPAVQDLTATLGRGGRGIAVSFYGLGPGVSAATAGFSGGGVIGSFFGW